MQRHSTMKNYDCVDSAIYNMYHTKAHGVLEVQQSTVTVEPLYSGQSWDSKIKGVSPFQGYCSMDMHIHVHVAGTEDVLITENQGCISLYRDSTACILIYIKLNDQFCLFFPLNLHCLPQFYQWMQTTNLNLNCATHIQVTWKTYMYYTQTTFNQKLVQ